MLVLTLARLKLALTLEIVLLHQEMKIISDRKKTKPDVEVRDLVSGRLMVARSRYCLCGTSGVHSLEAAWAEGGVSLGFLERVPMPGAEWRPRPAQGRW